MIRCHLSTFMGRNKLRISDVARKTGLNRSTVSALYRESATRLDLKAVDRLCTLFRCSVGELFEHVSARNTISASRGRQNVRQTQR
jgi:putative transcriptional regulator